MRTAAECGQQFNGLKKSCEAIALPGFCTDRAFGFTIVRIAHRSPTGFLRSVAHFFKLSDDPIPMIALDFDPSVFDGSARAKSGLQLGGKLDKALLVQWQIGDRHHSFAASALCFTAHSNHSGLARLVRLAGASLLQLAAFGAKGLSPIVIFHRVFFLTTFDTIQVLRPSSSAVGRPYPFRYITNLTSIV
ncbi:MAG: hypothetical protein ABFC77_09515 [Thermoguttaceae bacterium]